MGYGLSVRGGEANKMGFDVFYGYNCQRKAHSYYPEYLWNNQEKEYQNGRYSQDAIHEHAMKFIEDNKDKAFSIPPHAELCQPQDSIVDMYKGKFQEPHPWYDNGDYGTATNPRAQFAAMITRLDTYVGQIIDKLERRYLERLYLYSRAITALITREEQIRLSSTQRND